MTRSRSLALTGIGVIVVGIVLSTALDLWGSDSAGQAGNALFLIALVLGLGVIALSVASAAAAKVAGRRRRFGRRR